MKFEIDYKVPNGKLLRIDIVINASIIDNIKIYGDFFIHPESAITDLEISLINKNINEIKDILTKIIKEKKILIIGFSPIDLHNTINEKIKSNN